MRSIQWLSDACGSFSLNKISSVDFILILGVVGFFFLSILFLFALFCLFSHLNLFKSMANININMSFRLDITRCWSAFCYDTYTFPALTLIVAFNSKQRGKKLTFQIILLKSLKAAFSFELSQTLRFWCTPTYMHTHVYAACMHYEVILFIVMFTIKALLETVTLTVDVGSS